MRLARDRSLWVLVPEAIGSLKRPELLEPHLPELLEEFGWHDDGGRVWRHVHQRFLALLPATSR
jgi:hypothetical protein